MGLQLRALIGWAFTSALHILSSLLEDSGKPLKESAEATHFPSQLLPASESI